MFTTYTRNIVWCINSVLSCKCDHTKLSLSFLFIHLWKKSSFYFAQGSAHFGNDWNPLQTARMLHSSSLPFSKLGVELDRVQACMRPCPPDARPYMGKVPEFEGAYINAGHNCWGIAWAPACGKAIAELVLDGESKSVNLAPFDPARFTPDAKRGGRGRKRRGTSVGEQW